MGGAGVTNVRPRWLKTLAWSGAPLASLALTGALVDPPAEGSTAGSLPAPLAGAAAASPASAAHGGAAGRPNVLFVLVDDMSNDQLSYLPHVEALIADRGVTFDRAFSSTPLCSPARASILTGRYAHNHGVMGNGPRLGGGVRDFRDRHTLPVWLERSGYTTMLIGKYLNHYNRVPKYIPPGWTDWRAIQSELNYRTWGMNRNGKQVTFHNRYQTTEMGRQVRRAIARYGAMKRPFFMVASFRAPHAGQPEDPDDPPRFGTPNVSNRYRDALAGVVPPKPASFNERDVTDKPSFLQSRPSLRRSTAVEAWQQRTESLLSVDDEVASFVRSLRRIDELQDTLVVFASDNGFLLGQHRWRAKDVPYEEATHVPLLVRGPGFTGGRTAHQVVSLVDLTSTFVRAAGAHATRPLDGAPLQRVAADPAYLAGRSVLVEGGGAIVGSAGPLDSRQRFYWGVRTPDDKVLTRYATGEREYYDLDVDPEQLDNAVDDPTAQEQVDDLSALLGALRNCRGTACRAER
jgi:N-acetylglucosamine-6-sulfatase